MESKDLIKQLSVFLFWDVDPSAINPEAHQQFIIPRVMDRGTLNDVKTVWDYFGEETVKQVLLNTASLGKKTIRFFANQFDTSPEAFRAHRHPSTHWPE